MSRRAPRPAPPGRRPLGATVRDDLLEAGRALLTETGFQPLALRDVAERAGVNQAMVRYYFRDKHGFLEALLDDGFGRLVAAIGDRRTLAEVTGAAIAALNAMPWLPVLLTQSVYLSAELREQFIRQHAPRLVEALERVVPRRRGVLPHHAALVLLSALIFPQIARPVVSRVFQVQYDDAFARTFSTELARLFSTPDQEPGARSAASRGRAAPRPERTRR
jgi:AcrR family transcriptional regulator